MVTADTDIEGRVDVQWRRRVESDRRRALRPDAPQRSTCEAILARAAASGAEAVAVTGSTVRTRRTAVSDLDFMVIGPRLDLSGIREDVDVCTTSAGVFWARLTSGDDYILWTLRYGWVLHDEGMLHAAVRHIEQSGLVPSAERKHAQAVRSVHLANLVLGSGDVEAAREQCRAALTTVARWLLITEGVFPLARDELPQQLAQIGQTDLATALHATIHAAPEVEQLKAGLDLGERLAA